MFGWIISDFGLNDGIESGLVKTPRVVVRDDGIPDAQNFKSKLYHIIEMRELIKLTGIILFLLIDGKTGIVL